MLTSTLIVARDLATTALDDANSVINIDKGGNFRSNFRANTASMSNPNPFTTKGGWGNPHQHWLTCTDQNPPLLMALSWGRTPFFCLNHPIKMTRHN